jgi:hypothetical protein
VLLREAADPPENLIARNETFLRRNFLPYVGQYRIADIIYDVTINNRRSLP